MIEGTCRREGKIRGNCKTKTPKEQTIQEIYCI
jgi:hypothetical protein